MPTLNSCLGVTPNAIQLGILERFRPIEIGTFGEIVGYYEIADKSACALPLNGGRRFRPHQYSKPLLSVKN